MTHASGGGDVAGLAISTGDWYMICGGDIQVINTASSLADSWHIIGVTKASGSAQSRGHKWVAATNTWSHNAGSTMGDAGTTVGASGYVRLGSWDTFGEHLSGDQEWVAIWGRVLTDAEIEQCALSLQHLLSTGPLEVYVLDQSAVTQTVASLTGTSVQTARNGTSLAAASVPLWNRGYTVLGSPVTAAAGGLAISPDAVTVSVTPGTLAITTAADIAPQPVTITASAGTLSLSVGIDLTGATVSATPGALALGVGIEPAAETVTVTPGDVSLAMGMNLGGASVTVSPGDVSLAMNMDLGGASVTVSPGTVAITSNTAIVPADVAISVTPGTLTITGDQFITPAALTISVTPGAMTMGTGNPVFPGPVTITASAGALNIALSTVLAGAAVSVSPGDVTCSVDVPLIDPGVSVVPGTVTVTQGPAVALVGATISVSPSTVTVATATITRRDTMVLPIAEDLLACLCVAVAEAPNPPASCCLRPGVTVAQGVSEREDECCEGLAWVRVSRVFPTGDEAGFPNVNEQTSACNPPSYGIELEMGVYRCAPTGDERNLPTCDEWTAATEQILDDAASMRRAWCCFRDNYANDAKLIGQWTPVEVQGGCTGGKMTIMIESYCTDCLGEGS